MERTERSAYNWPFQDLAGVVKLKAYSLYQLNRFVLTILFNSLGFKSHKLIRDSGKFLMVRKQFSEAVPNCLKIERRRFFMKMSINIFRTQLQCCFSTFQLRDIMIVAILKV
jgi:hypothetical protein